jgi:hypothetical protein
MRARRPTCGPPAHLGAEFDRHVAAGHLRQLVEAVHAAQPRGQHLQHPEVQERVGLGLVALALRKGATGGARQEEPEVDWVASMDKQPCAAHANQFSENTSALLHPKHAPP